MGTNIFLLVNGFGISFLIYVFANFWKELQRGGRIISERAKTGSRRSSRIDRPRVVIVTEPISHNIGERFPITSAQNHGLSEQRFQTFVAEIEAQEADRASLWTIEGGD